MKTNEAKSNKMNAHELINTIATTAKASGAAFHPTRDPSQNAAAIAAVCAAAKALGCERLTPWIPKRQRGWHQLASAYVLS